MIPYDLRKITTAIFDVDGVLSAQTVLTAPDGDLLRTANVRDGWAIREALRRGLRIIILTGGSSESVRLRYERLGVGDIVMGSADKLRDYEALKARYALSDEEILYMGDDLPDVPVMRRAGCPCCPEDACPEAKSAAIYISRLPGGQGCCRDVLEQVMRVKELIIKSSCSGLGVAGAPSEE